jgi:ribosomal-protein-alanine N-acetyltransferase
MPVPEPWLTTERLALRRFTLEDLAWLVTLRSDADVMRYAGGPQTDEATASVLSSRILEYYDRHPGLGIWLTMERLTDEPVGFHVLNHVYGEAFVQVGFFLSKKVWGRGFGTEMARALIHHGFETLAIPQIVALADVHNHASHRVLTKIGLRRRGERSFPHPAYAAMGPMAWFERERTDWTADVTTVA